MHHLMPPSKTGWPSLNWWFFHLWCPSSWTSQNSDHRGDYWTNSRANLVRRPDFGSINSQATGHLTWAGWVFHSRRFGHAEALCEVGPEMAECRSKTSKVPVVWANLEFFRHDANYFLPRLITVDETWLYHYDPETKQQSMEWRHSGSPSPKKFRVQKPLEKFWPWLCGIKKASSTLIIFQRTKLSTRSITHLCWCNWRTFWRKNPAGNSPSVSCSCTTMPRLIGHLQTRRSWPTWASSVLITHPILRIWDYVEYIPSLVAVTCFLPGGAKDLSTPRSTFNSSIEERTFE